MVFQVEYFYLRGFKVQLLRGEIAGMNGNNPVCANNQRLFLFWGGAGHLQQGSRVDKRHYRLRFFLFLPVGDGA